MLDNKVKWSLILFILMPVAYSYAIISLMAIGQGGKPAHYLILGLCCVVIIFVNVLIIKKIAKE